MLKKSLALNKNDEVTVNNYKVLNKLLENKELKNWEDYLLRETDYDYLDELEENEKFQKQCEILPILQTRNMIFSSH